MTDETTLPKPLPPMVTYEQVEAEFKENGVDLRDMLESQGHFDRWRIAKGLPSVDADGKDGGSSAIYMQMYMDDPEGEAARPAYIDFWHWLMDAYEPFPWVEGKNERHKDVPLANGVFPPRADLTEQDLSSLRERIEAKSEPMPEDAWRGLRRHASEGPLRQRKAAETVATIVARHGKGDIGGFGAVVLLRMKVDH